MHLLLQARRLLAEMDKPEARQLVEVIDNSVADDELITAAKQRVEYLGDDCEFDEWAVVSEADGETWVNAWVWVAQDEDEGGDD